MRTTRCAAFVAVLAVIGLVVSVAAVWPRLAPATPVQDNEPGPPVVAAPTRPAPSVGRVDARSTTQQRLAAPVRMTLASAGLDNPVVPVGVAADGQMALPPNPRVFGWYRFGPAPGSGAGSVVLAGHLDSRRFGLGPLVRLREVSVGDRVRMFGAGSATATYRVIEIERFRRTALPERLFRRSGPERLRIITCGGDYDADEGGYQENLVVTAAPWK